MGTTIANKVKIIKRFKLKGSWNQNKYALLFLFPWLLGILIFSIIPMISSLYLSFTDYDLFRAPGWVGFSNYTGMFTQDSRFTASISVTLKYVFIGVPLQLIFALLIATFLNKGIPGLPIFRAIFYVPSLLGGSVAIALLWRQVFGAEGIFNKMLAFIGLEGVSNISWISHPEYSIYTLILLLVWQFGSSMVIFLAGLKQIPVELYEAADMDGAGRLNQFFIITLPLLTPIIFFNLVMQIISAFQAFTPAFILGRGTGGPLDSILFYTLYLYFLAFNEFRMGYASAMAWFLLVMIALITALLFITSKKWVYYTD